MEAPFACKYAEESAVQRAFVGVGPLQGPTRAYREPRAAMFADIKMPNQVDVTIREFSKVSQNMLQPHFQIALGSKFDVIFCCLHLSFELCDHFRHSST